MIKTVYHFEISEGTDFTQSFLYGDPCSGLPNDLTNFTADFKAKQNNNGTYDGFNNPNVVLNLFAPNGGIVLGGATGLVTITIAASLTTALTWNQAVYNLVLIDPTGKRIPFMSGFLTILSNADS